ncbi:MAG TPA: hypothetical protein VIG32_09805 [Candidatus Baltobacteraceae bacterium]|jgi:hypothetical protein
MSIAADYARAVAALDSGHFPAYVSYDSRDWARGIDRESDGPQTVYVRTKDGAIVQGPPSEHRNPQIAVNDERGSNPISDPAFKARCYRAQSEESVQRNGRAALRFDLAPTCGPNDDYPFATLYADAQTLVPIEVDGTVSTEGVRVRLAQNFAQFNGYTLPSTLLVDVKGRGLLFWLREHAQLQYSDYKFYAANPVPRRQTAKPL